MSAVSTGRANRRPMAAARNAKQKSGIRFSDMPGARDLSSVTMKCPRRQRRRDELKMIPRQ